MLNFFGYSDIWSDEFEAAPQCQVSFPVRKKNRIREKMEARVGFEPTNGGFADLSLGPLGYRAKLLSIAKILEVPGN
jgi:hypothetical protein